MGASLICGVRQQLAASQMISRDLIEGMFRKMEVDDGWDLSVPMVWGYFFTHSERQSLERLGRTLSERDYSIVGIYLTNSDDEGQKLPWWLHVERVESHSVETLMARNEVLTDLAKTYGIDAYDGMDVGPYERPGSVA